MTVLRWILGGLFVLILMGWVFTLLALLVSGDGRWRDLGLKARRYGYLLALVWFNAEVWGRVLISLLG